MSPLQTIGFLVFLGCVSGGIIGDYSHEFGGHPESYEGFGTDEHHFDEHGAVDFGGSYEHHDLFSGHHEQLHDFDSKPIPGINHGKGVLSYSTTYEFLDPVKQH